MIENWRWGNDTSTAKSSFVSSPLLPERPGVEAKQSPVGPLMCGAHLFIAALVFSRRRQVQQSIKDHFPVRRSSRRCKTVLEVRHYLQ